MNNLIQARKQLKFWRKQYEKAYQYHKNTWDYEVRQAAIKCKEWRAEINKLRNRKDGTNVG
jgi:hypothetical protein